MACPCPEFIVFYHHLGVDYRSIGTCHRAFYISTLD
ncbi:hypothetical protein VPHK469_0223 [Vibrio phage K469]